MSVEHVGTYWSCICGHVWFSYLKHPPESCPKCRIRRFGKRGVARQIGITKRGNRKKVGPQSSATE